MQDKNGPGRDQLVDQVLSGVELDAQDVAGVMPGLEALVDALAKEETLTEAGFAQARALMEDNLRRLAAIRADRKRFPDIAKVEISPTLFILGMPRCGTSLLHALLAADPETRAPLMWEVADPSPPPEASTFDSDPRIKRFDDFVDAAFAGEWRDVRKAHPIGARIPQECGMILQTAYCGLEPCMRFRVQDFYQWYLNADTAYGYRIHREWLQHLQWRNPKRRWALKVQEHMYHMPELMAAYPDAIIIQPHRDPVTAIASISQLIRTIRSSALANQDPVALGREMLHLWNDGLVRAINYRKAHPGLRVYDMRYKDLAADPVAALRDLYRFCNIEFTSAAEAGIRRWLAENPSDKHGRHTYSLEDFGLTKRDVLDVYGPYLEEYRDYL